MPELPEVETTLQGIKPFIEKKILKDILVHQPQLRWQVPQALQQAKGQLIQKVYRRAKYLLMECETGTIIIHLGMSGNLGLFDHHSPIKKHDHIEWFFDDMILRYHDPRRFGCVLWHSGKIEQHPLFAHLGVEPLSEAFTANYLYQAGKQRHISIKQLLMDAQVVSGIGNIYANESLFMAKIHPKRKSNHLSQVRYRILTGQIKKVLKEAIKQGGTTLKDFVNSQGKPGYFQQQLQVYGKANQACPVCHTPIKKITQNQRASFYCPHCQR